jgi:hypothetical protein
MSRAASFTATKMGGARSKPVVTARDAPRAPTAHRDHDAQTVHWSSHNTSVAKASTFASIAVLS